MMYKIFLLLAFLPFRSQAQPERHINLNDTVAYFKSTPDTPRIEKFAVGIRINFDTNDVIILIKHDSLYVTYKKRYFPVESLQKLDDFIKNVLE
jgi:hypothetical protein